MIRDVIAGAEPEAAQLDYELARDHVGVIAWGRDPDAALDRLAGELERPMLRVAAGRDTAWAWLGSAEDWTEADVRALEHETVRGQRWRSDRVGPLLIGRSPPGWINGRRLQGDAQSGGNGDNRDRAYVRGRKSTGDDLDAEDDDRAGQDFGYDSKAQHR